MKSDINKIEIKLSKIKISMLLVGAIVFVVLGALLAITPETFVSPIFINANIMRILGIAGVAFFGVACVYGFRKLLDNSVGLIIDEKGITDNTNASSVGLISWDDIDKIEAKQIMSTKFLLVFVKDSNKYLDMVSGFKRRMLKENERIYGTPISIISNTLKCKFEDLVIIINDSFKKYKKV